MGSSQDKQESKQSMNSLQTQVIEQNYSNNIMMLALSTLQSICRKLLGKDGKSDHKKYGNQDKVDYSSKNLAQLVSQFKTHLFLFRISKQQMQEDFKNSQGFVFPKNFPKDKVIQEINTFKSICLVSKDMNLIRFCEDFIKIVSGQYSDLSFQKTNFRVEYTAQERQGIKKNLLKDGIHATTLMNELREKVQKKGISNQSDLKVKINKTDVEYENEGRRIREGIK